MFQFRHQPLAALYVLYTILTVLFFRLPYWLISAIPASKRGRPSWSIRRVIEIHVLQTFIRTWHATSLPQAEAPEKAEKSAQKTGFVWLDPTPHLVVGEIAELARVNQVGPTRVSGYWYGVRGSDGRVGQKANPNEKVIIHFHGGGYVMGSGSPNDMICAPICNGYLQHFPQIKRVFTVEYRLASSAPFRPANHFPSAVIDALAGYSYLIHSVGFLPENIIVSGDSAGAHLAVSLTRHLVQSSFKDVQPPRNLLLLSPTVEWMVTHVGPDSTEELNKNSDYSQPFFHGYSARAIAGNIGEDAVLTKMWISPGSLKIENPDGWFTGFPRTCISAGETECHLDAMATFRRRLAHDIGEEKIAWIETYGATHDFIGLEMQEPERTEALKDLAKWIQTC